MKIIGSVAFIVVASHAGVALLHHHHHQSAALHGPATVSAAVSYPRCTAALFSMAIASPVSLHEIAY